MVLDLNQLKYISVPQFKCQLKFAQLKKYSRACFLYSGQSILSLSCAQCWTLVESCTSVAAGYLLAMNTFPPNF